MIEQKRIGTSTLSDKRFCSCCGTVKKCHYGETNYHYEEKDVKESIKRLKSNIEDLYLWEYNESVMKEIDKIFGKRLIE